MVDWMKNEKNERGQVPFPEVTTVTACRSCGAAPLAPILSFGEMPLANALVLPSVLDRREPRYPLEVVWCPNCFLVQLSASVTPEILYRDYPYLSSFSDTFVAHARAIVERMIDERPWDGERLVVEIASNDGYL